jgi:hypothetical protein
MDEEGPVGDEDDPERDSSEFSEEMGEDNPECGPLEYTTETRKITLYKLTWTEKRLRRWMAALCCFLGMASRIV